MEKRFLKSKALFMIFILVCMIFTVSNMDSVSADEQMVCCEETSTDYCVYTTEDNCVTNTVADTSCELTTFCETGCCVSDEGTCSKNVPKAKCENTEGYTWSEGASCDVPQCEQNCCVIADYQCSYTTEAYCEYLIEDMEHIEKDFRSVDSEASCSDICRESEKGCCVGDDLCTYGTRGECVSPEIDISSGDGFYSGFYCADVEPYCEMCESCVSTQCIGEDVYCFDSCGNQEGVAPGGDCNYLAGEWCGYNGGGEAACLKTDCTDDVLFDGAYFDGQRNPHDSKIAVDWSGNAMKRDHGESWCLYESPVGGYMDRPGSQHYRTYCYFGEQIIEACQDQRDEVCIQSPYTRYYINGTDSLLDNVWVEQSKTSDDTRAAACVDNGAFTTSVINSNITTVTMGGNEDCGSATTSCEVVYALENWAARWNCVQNCHCLTQEWADQMATVCRTAGDCGADFSITNEFTDDGFYLTHSDTRVAEKSLYVGADVAYDSYWDWMENYVEGGDTFSANESDCRSGSGRPAGCELVTSMNQDASSNWKNYGVYGGVVAFAEYMTELGSIGEVKFTENTAKQVVAGILIATVIIASAIAAAATGTTVTLGVLLSFAAVSSSVPVVGWIAGIVIILIAVVLIIFSLGSDTQSVTVTANCEAWQPVTSSADCELCDIPVSEGGLAIDNSDPNGLEVLRGYECSEYKCLSLGYCEFVEENLGSNRPKCVQGVPDETPPHLETYMVDLSENMNAEGCADTDGYVTNSLHGCYNFVPDVALVIEKEVNPYEYVTFGFETDDLSQCKITEDSNITDYDEMGQYFPDSYYAKGHNQTWILTPGEEFNFYIRCQNHAGAKMDKFVQVKITTDDGPDITPASIEAYETTTRNDYVPYDWNYTLVTFYINEPVRNCKWDYNDVDIELMSGLFVPSTCPGAASAYYTSTVTTGLNVSAGENNYYIRCEDCSGNNNTQGYPVTLYGTEPLVIDNVYPLGETFYTNDITMSVATSSGAQDGKAICYYNNIEFFDTNSTTHAQQLQDLNAGDFSYDIDCYDIAGNVNSTEITFSIDVDIDTPELVSIYTDGVMIYYEMSEVVSCEYYFEDFEFGSGTAVSSSSTEGSFAYATNIDTYYLTCQDMYGNEGSFIIGTDYFEG